MLAVAWKGEILRNIAEEDKQIIKVKEHKESTLSGILMIIFRGNRFGFQFTEETGRLSRD